MDFQSISDNKKLKILNTFFKKVPRYRYFGTIFERVSSVPVTVLKSTAVLLYSVLPTFETMVHLNIKIQIQSNLYAEMGTIFIFKITLF